MNHGSQSSGLVRMTVFDEMGGAIVANRDVKIVEFEIKKVGIRDLC